MLSNAATAARQVRSSVQVRGWRWWLGPSATVLTARAFCDSFDGSRLGDDGGTPDTCSLQRVLGDVLKVLFSRENICLSDWVKLSIGVDVPSIYSRRPSSKSLCTRLSANLLIGTVNFALNKTVLTPILLTDLESQRKRKSNSFTVNSVTDWVAARSLG